LVTYYFFQHLQLVLRTISLNLLFLYELTLGLLTDDYGSAKFLRLSKVLAFRHWLVGLCRTSDFAILNFERFLGRFCYVVIVELGLVSAKGTSVDFVNNNRVFHRL